MHTLHLVSHTHWDREWYLTFQQFRLKLVHMIDHLLEILETHPDYRYFMLDGQTIVLDDYLHMRPEKRDLLRDHIRSGRILTGPWYVLADEFLVSPEALIRNLLEGERIVRGFGPKMNIGYLPDTFGHIGQMPQILRGFGIDTASVWRGLADESCELWWEAPDGSRVFTAYLRESYSNAASLITHYPEQFLSQIIQIRDALKKYCSVPIILLMNGTDHAEPDPAIPAAIRLANEKLNGDVLIHSTLPQYIEAVRNANSANKLPTVKGELRQCKRTPLLPGVLSTRIWIKQRNHANQVLLEKWVEPFAIWAEQVAAATDPDTLEKIPWINPTASLIRQAWRLLMENHPHDSICGCSIDQVGEEIRTRFDQVDQIALELIEQSLQTISMQVNTLPNSLSSRGVLTESNPNNTPSIKNSDEPYAAVIVFNPLPAARTDLVTIEVEVPPGINNIELIDENGAILPCSASHIERRDFVTMKLNRIQLMAMLGIIRTGKAGNLVIKDSVFRTEKKTMFIEVVMTEGSKPDEEILQHAINDLKKGLADKSITTFMIHAQAPAKATMQFVARDIPDCGYRTFWLRPATDRSSTTSTTELILENEFIKASVSPSDGTFNIYHKPTRMNYTGLNRFSDSGDAGDEYNYSPPVKDQVVTSNQAVVDSISYGQTPECQFIEVRLTLPIPAELSPDRKKRSDNMVLLTIISRASLQPGVPRLDFTTEVENRAKDHRLKVHFPLPFNSKKVDCDGHFEVVQRKAGIPRAGRGWMEQPMPEMPQRSFINVSSGSKGLMIANRGLPEAAVLPAGIGKSEIALTLLRCVGWLSRDDFSTRNGHAGPMMETPATQMPGKWIYAYSIIPHEGDWKTTFKHADAFNVPLRAVTTGLHSGSYPASLSFLQVSPHLFALSAVKPAEDDSGYIVRGYNLEDKSIDVRLEFHKKPLQVHQVQMDESGGLSLPLGQDHSVQFTAGPHSVVSLHITPVQDSSEQRKATDFDR